MANPNDHNKRKITNERVLSAASLPAGKQAMRAVNVLVQGDYTALLGQRLNQTTLEPEPRENLPNRGATIHYTHFDSTYSPLSKGMSQLLNQASATVICIDATNELKFEGQLNAFAATYKQLGNGTPVVIVATHIDEMVGSIQQRRAVLEALEAGRLNQKLDSPEANQACQKLHEIFDAIPPEQINRLAQIGKSFYNGADTSDDFIKLISQELSALYNANKSDEVDPTNIATLLRQISASPTIIESANKNSEAKIEGKMQMISAATENVATRLAENNNKVTFVLSSSSDPSTAAELASKYEDTFKSKAFENKGTEDPFLLAINKAAPRKMLSWTVREKSGDLKEMAREEEQEVKSTPRPGQ